jgi:hypothetical protein
MASFVWKAPRRARLAGHDEQPFWREAAFVKNEGAS